MPLYDKRCNVCGLERLDVLEAFDAPLVSCKQEAYPGQPKYYTCTGKMERVWMSRANAVIGDEIDVEIKHGLCHEDGTPRRFRSRTELRKAEQKAGLTNFVEHRPAPGTDKSKHTQRWV